jgi:hypothetical protein
MNFQIHKNYANGTRPRFHFDAYKAAGGYYFIEICCLTIEIDVSRGKIPSKTKWYMPSRLFFWFVFSLSTVAQATGLVTTTEEELTHSAAWGLYMLLIIWNN